MFKKIFVGLVLAALSFTAAGETSTSVDTSGLTPAQVAELKAHAAKAVADAANQRSAPPAPGAVMTLAATWGQQAATAAEGFAKALGIAAKELGVTVNEFLKTDAGKLTAALIIWKVAGSTIITMLYGILFITVGLTFTRMIYTRLFTAGYEKVEYSRWGGLFKGTKMVRVPKTFGQLNKDGEWLALWIMLFAGAATLGFGAAFF